MSNYEPTKSHLREILLIFFNSKKTAVEARRLICEVYGEDAIQESTSRKWFQRFKSGDFDTKVKERPGKSKAFEDAELMAILDEDSCQTQQEMANTLGTAQQTISDRLRAMGMVQKKGNWLPYELKPRDIEKRFCISEQLLQRQRRKGFLDRIVTGDEKWIHYDNVKCRNSWGKPGHKAVSMPKPNFHGTKVMLCVWWDQLGVIFYEVLKQGETITGDLYKEKLVRLSQAIKDKRPQFHQRHNKVILQHDNARPHTCRVVKEYLEKLNWEVLPHPPYSPDLAPSDFHLFRSMAHGLADQHFGSYEECKKWVDDWFCARGPEFWGRGIRLLPERWEKVVTSDGQYFE